MIGCYTEPAGRGAGVTLVAVDGSMVAQVDSPSYLAVHPSLPLVYAVLEQAEGRLVTLRREPTGLVAVDDRPTGGADPCHLALSSDGAWLGVANYTGGSLAVFALGPDGLPSADPQLISYTGSGPHPERQLSPHPHQVVFDGDLLTVVDLGTDRVRRYSVDGQQWHAVPDALLRKGSGPRHYVVDGDLRHVVGELDGTLTSYRVDVAGVWHEVGVTSTSSHPADKAPSHIALHDGLIYVANRGADTIAAFSVENGLPLLLGEVPTGGAWPRQFVIVGDRLLVANERSHEVTALRLTDGVPTPAGADQRLVSGSPTCIAVAPATP